MTNDAKSLSPAVSLIETIWVENYKSIDKLTLHLGRINVFIGENGAGKTNILEAIALAGAAQAEKLDNEFLASRGIRVSTPKLMRSALKSNDLGKPIKIAAKFRDGFELRYELTNDDKPYSSWIKSAVHSSGASPVVAVNWLKREIESIADPAERVKVAEDLLKQLTKALNSVSSDDLKKVKSRPKLTFERSELSSHSRFTKHPWDDNGVLANFIVYAPENSALRLFEREGQIEPLGTNGEGLLKLLGVISNSNDSKTINAVKDSLRMISWFDDFRIVKSRTRDRIEIYDQFFSSTKLTLDQRSANEGFLFLAFYFALFASDLTPAFFAIDNIESSFNPKLCEMVMVRLTRLATEHEKQVLYTTHNPAILDGLDLNDPEQRLFIVSRGLNGQTKVRRFEKKPSVGKIRRLSELFLSGALGGLPKTF